MAQIGRNDPCPCGSGKKYKQCCIPKSEPIQQISVRPESPPVETLPMAAMGQLAALFQAGRFADMEQVTLGLLKQHPNSGFAWRALGAALQVQNKDALFALQRATTLLPNDPDSFNNLGNALRNVGRAEEAIASFRRALALRPDYAEAYNNLGNAFRDIRQIDNAIASFQSALVERPGYPEANNNLGLVLQETGRLEDALVCYRTALQAKPDFAEAHSNLGNALKDLGRLDDAVESCRLALELNPSSPEAHSNLLMALQYHSKTSALELLDEHRRFGQYFETALKPQWLTHANSRDPHKRLKVGYVSGDFREHAVSYFIEPVIANHDRSRIEVYCYSNSNIHDTVTDRLRSAADHWIACANLNDDELAQRIRADNIDILIDLSGHTAGNRLLTFARKPALIQITYLGYLGTSGLSAMDYRLTDNYAEPVDYDRYYAERLLRLPDSMWCFRPPEEPHLSPPLSPLPALTNGYLTFGSFNNVNKIGPEAIELWAELLRSLPSSRLLMMAPQEMRRGLAVRFYSLGVAEHRVQFCERMKAIEFRKKLQQVDITLDSQPVNGATTTCESLWQGVPVLTLVGQRFLSRNGLSVLNAASLPEFAANTQEEYIQIANSLANDLPRLTAIRMGMRERLKNTPLLDQQRFTRNLEGIYRDVWSQYLSS